MIGVVEHAHTGESKMITLDQIDAIKVRANERLIVKCKELFPDKDPYEYTVSSAQIKAILGAYFETRYQFEKLILPTARQ